MTSLICGRYMTPSQRVVMEDGYTVLFRAGHTKACSAFAHVRSAGKDSLRGRNVGVFLGDTGSVALACCSMQLLSVKLPGLVSLPSGRACDEERGGASVGGSCGNGQESLTVTGGEFKEMEDESEAFTPWA